MKTPSPPRPRPEPRRIEQLGRVRVDDYPWMKDDDWRAVLRHPSRVASRIRDHLEAENAYVEAVLAPAERLRAALLAEMIGRLQPDESSPPARDGPFRYFTGFEPGAEYPRHLRQPADGGAIEVLLDEAAEAAGKPFWSVAEASHSPDHALFAWAADETGSECHRIHVRDLATGAAAAEPIESAYGDFTFSPCSRHLFWIWRDAQARPAKVFRRQARGGPDTLVYEEPDEGMFLSVGLTADRAFILIESHNQETSEIRFIAAAEPQAPPIVAEPRRAGHRYDLDHWSDRWVARSNSGEAIDFALFTSDAEIPAEATWRPLVEHRRGRLIAGFILYELHLVRLEREDATDRLVVRTRAGSERAIAFDEPVCALGLARGYEYATAWTRFVYQSPTMPRQWFDYDMEGGERRLVQAQQIPSGHDPARYRAWRLVTEATDGARIPITLLARADRQPDGSAPLILHGYGAYGIPSQATFSTQALSLVDRGWVWAIAHVRGGSDKGWGWFLEGRGRSKKNTFTDFIACAEHLIAARWTAPKRIVAHGGSAGGLLVGAALNLAPELFGAAIALVPFVDVLNTMSDPDLPLTPPEWPEWGNPLENPEDYDAIAAYSPYDNVAEAPYPSVFARAGLSDPRVCWWEPEKWIARLRARSTSGAPMLLKTELEAGHGGPSGRYRRLEDWALEFAFAQSALGEPLD